MHDGVEMISGPVKAMPVVDLQFRMAVGIICLHLCTKEPLHPTEVDLIDMVDEYRASQGWPGVYETIDLMTAEVMKEELLNPPLEDEEDK